MHDKNRENKIIPDEEMILRLKNFWVWGLEWERKDWGDEETKTVERDRGEMKKNRVVTIYRHICNLTYQQVSKIKICQKELSSSYREVSIAKGARASIEHTENSLVDQEVIKHLSSIQKLPWWIKKLSKSYWDWISMDQDCDNSYQEKKLKRLDR